MGQERYFDYRSEIKSKKSAEHGALINGVGPIFGFDKYSLDFNNGTLTLDSNNPKNIQELTTKLPFGKYLKNIRYINNENGAFKSYIGGVITLDGILTVVDEPIIIELPEDFMAAYELSKTQDYTYNWALIISASHVYSKTPSVYATKFRISTFLQGSLQGSVSKHYGIGTRYQSLSMDYWFKDLSSWYSDLDDKSNIYKSLTEPNEVFVGILNIWSNLGSLLDPKKVPINDVKLSSGININFVNKLVIPYNYEYLYTLGSQGIRRIGDSDYFLDFSDIPKPNEDSTNIINTITTGSYSPVVYLYVSNDNTIESSNTPTGVGKNVTEVGSKVFFIKLTRREDTGYLEAEIMYSWRGLFTGYDEGTFSSTSETAGITFDCSISKLGLIEELVKRGMIDCNMMISGSNVFITNHEMVCNFKITRTTDNKSTDFKSTSEHKIDNSGLDIRTISKYQSRNLFGTRIFPPSAGFWKPSKLQVVAQFKTKILINTTSLV